MLPSSMIAMIAMIITSLIGNLEYKQIQGISNRARPFYIDHMEPDDEMFEHCLVM